MKDKALLERWYQAANAGPEQHQQMVNNALLAGNSVFIDFVLEDKGAKFDRLSFTGEPTERLINAVVTREYGDYKRVVSLWSQAQKEQRADFEQLISTNYQKTLRQLDLLLTHANLTPEEKEGIIATRTTLEKEIKELEQLFAGAVDLNTLARW